MKKEEIKKLLENDFEEITIEEWEVRDCGQGDLKVGFDGNDNLYFKPKQKFPIVYDSNDWKIEVYEDGVIKLKSKKSIDKDYDTVVIGLDSELYKAVEKSKELRK
ncbi:hypothetical protein KAH94_06730 [bacterium]|nr:hypothetical protein [bacterium]